jgi:hypothetical protein
MRQSVRGAIEGLFGMHGHSGTPEEKQAAGKRAIENFAGTYGSCVCKGTPNSFATLAAIDDARGDDA